jgi:hypothetical protein
MYSAFLVEKDIEHEYSIFNQFLKKIITGLKQVKSILSKTMQLFNYEFGKLFDWIYISMEYGERTKTTICSIRVVKK